jgi:polyphosphate kinase 2 (PPK2 family)
MGRLDKLDLSLKLSKEEEAERLDAGWKRLAGLRLALGAKLPGYALGPPVCVPFEGWDASGKGGAIKRLVASAGHAARPGGAIRGAKPRRGAPALPVAILHISEEEQLQRFEQRRDDPLKSWKLTLVDWENRRERPQYREAIEDMPARTDHDPSPWHLVEAENKKYARVKVVETVIERIEQGMRARQIEPPAFGT